MTDTVKLIERLARAARAMRGRDFMTPAGPEQFNAWANLCEEAADQLSAAAITNKAFEVVMKPLP